MVFLNQVYIKKIACSSPFMTNLLTYLMLVRHSSDTAHCQVPLAPHTPQHFAVCQPWYFDRFRAAVVWVAVGTDRGQSL